MNKLFEYLPRGNLLDDDAWRNRHRLVMRVLTLHLPLLLAFGLYMHSTPRTLAECLAVPVICLLVGRALHARAAASIIVTAGLTWCSFAFVLMSNGSIEAHFHFFIIVGFIALYHDWTPFLWNIIFTVVSHGVGSAFPSIKIFNHPAAQASPWVWSAIHGVGVLAACVGLVMFWRVSEEDQRRAILAQRQADAELGRQKFSSDLLVNLARRNQSMLYRQLDIINQLEEKERDPDALADLFRVDHLATRIRRNAESLMVLSGETPARVWSEPVPLREVVQAAIAETEDLERVRFTVDERVSVAGHTVTDLTHLLAELTENAVRFSPPNTQVTISVRPLPQRPGAQLVTIEDWGLGMLPEAIRDTNQLLAHPPEVDLSVSQRLGFHVVARLAQRHKIEISVTPTPGGGVTAIIVLPPELFAPGPVDRGAGQPVAARHAVAHVDPPPRARAVTAGAGGGWGRTSRPVPRQTWRPVSPESLSPESSPSDLSELAESAVDQLSSAGPDGRGRWDGWWAAEPAQPRTGAEPAQPRTGAEPAQPRGGPEPAQPRNVVERKPADYGAPSPGPGPSMDSMNEPPGTRDFMGSESPNRPAGVADQNRGADQMPGLNRRRPQSHLAPELLKPRPTPYKRERPEIPDPRPTSEALSRYQASRQAAQAEARQGGQSNTRGAR